MQRKDELAVFITSRESICDECHENLGRKAWIQLTADKKAFCLACADLDHLIFLPRGDTALTRRARSHSTLSAVVLKWSQSRKRFERQGLLIEEPALRRAEEECLADSDVRERRRLREAEHRLETDQEYLVRFAARVRAIFPCCPKGREAAIAEHACRKYSGRVGRSASAKTLDENAVRLAVIAHIRHRETDYDKLLSRGFDRADARGMVKGEIDEVLKKWGTT
ncbi:MAG: DUF2293 domain-containing protein [Acidobacteria bacterium]|nr:DUF2293 domain-containing protein [Acidobacteriota bacterium]MCI0621575.1 DUF2293 domain-containing protein [Acidobacteriota bacterium]MCI0718147.1 DUF2293 domain-containing protein [Acidobacteriota bacterium]